MDQKDLEEIMKNVIDGYLPGALEKNLPALPKGDEIGDLRCQLAVVCAVLAVVIRANHDYKVITNAVKSIVERMENEFGVDLELPRGVLLDVLEMEVPT